MGCGAVYCGVELSYFQNILDALLRAGASLEQAVATLVNSLITPAPSILTPQPVVPSVPLSVGQVVPVADAGAQTPDPSSQATASDNPFAAVELIRKTFGSGAFGGPPGGPNWGKGFKSFKQLKNYLGKLEEGYEWPHIVEQ